jgi:hypothetical protein
MMPYGDRFDYQDNKIKQNNTYKTLSAKQYGKAHWRNEDYIRMNVHRNAN